MTESEPEELTLDMDDAGEDAQDNADVAQHQSGDATDASESNSAGGRKKKNNSGKKSSKKEASKGEKADKKDQRGKYNKNKSGKKQCRACQKWLPMDKFPIGSADCEVDKPAIQNLRAAAVAQDKKDKFDKILTDPVRLPKLVAAFHERCPRQGKKRRERFALTQWFEDHRQESNVLTDGIYEMMDEKMFICQMAKPKHGALDHEDAKKEFAALVAAPKTITDLKGRDPKKPQRCAIKVKDTITVRDASITSRGYRTCEQEVKKPDEEAVAAQKNRLARGSAPEGFGDGRLEAAQQMMQGRSAGGKDEEMSAFGNVGRGSVDVGNVHELFDGVEQAMKGEVKNDDDATSSDADGEKESKSKSGASSNASLSKKTAWFNADEKIGAAIKSYDSWIATTRAECHKVLKSMDDCRAQVEPELHSVCAGELKIVETRRNGLKLVVANSPSIEDLRHGHGNLF